MSQSLKTIVGGLWNKAWRDLGFRVTEGADGGCELWEEGWIQETDTCAINIRCE